ncbi:hypothetical protein P4A93_17755 [Pseudomonas syringae pv. syringae]|uniref:hypothetical protein n=1 Tax=Pseudomonas syringae TaxID=317 RepID=UPI0023F82424|nr:hypothetical protein [Pseudomonas syringae]MDF5893455.1 hypothetical protein [Pseudomonas syringae pv. syringae]
MDDVGKNIIYMDKKLKDRAAVVKRKQYLRERKLRQAHTLALMCLETSDDLHPDAVIAALKVSDRYTETLRGCIQILGGSSLQTIATFPEGEVEIDKLSQ